MSSSRTELASARSFAFNPVGETLLTVHADTSPTESHGYLINVWDLTTSAELTSIEGHSGVVHDASFSSDGSFVLSASSDKTAKVWCATTGRCVRSLEGHSDEVFKALFSPNGKLIATASGDRTVRLWRTGNGECLAVFDDHDGVVWRIEFSSDGGTLASADREGVVGLHSTTQFMEVRSRLRSSF